MATVFLTSGLLNPPPVPVPLWRGTEQTFTSWDGTVWDLADPTGGMVLARTGVQGLDMPPFDEFTSDSPATHGARWRGARATPRPVFWPALVATRDGSEAWVQIDSKLRRALNPLGKDKVGLWTVTAPGSGTRTLQVRFSKRDDSYDRDPARLGWHIYGLSFTAHWPFWQGEPIVVSWGGSTTDKDFFTPGAGFAYWINSSFTVGSATVTNPGDVDAHPVWTLHGPFTTASVGCNGLTVSVPFSMSSGQSLIIDTWAKTAITDAGVNRTKDLGSAGFAQVPPGAEVPLDIAITAGARVEMSLTPNYLGAW